MKDRRNFFRTRLLTHSWRFYEFTGVNVAREGMDVARRIMDLQQMNWKAMGFPWNLYMLRDVFLSRTTRPYGPAGKKSGVAKRRNSWATKIRWNGKETQKKNEKNKKNKHKDVRKKEEAVRKKSVHLSFGHTEGRGRGSFSLADLHVSVLNYAISLDESYCVFSSLALSKFQVDV